MNEKTLDYLESQIPDLVAISFSLARFNALNCGYSVIEADSDGNLFELFPDGDRIFIKKCASDIRMAVGSVFLMN